MSSEIHVYVFPLVNVVLFPRTTKPLNIFEPRYIRMVEDAVRNKSPIALAFVEEDSEIQPIGSSPEIEKDFSKIKTVVGYGFPEVIDQRSNGSLLIFIRGDGKLQLQKAIESDTPYLVYSANVIPENLNLEESLNDKVELLKKSITRWLTQHLPNMLEREAFLKNLTGPQEIVGAFASYMVKDADMQQYIFELDDINEKVNVLYRLLESDETTA